MSQCAAGRELNVLCTTPITWFFFSENDLDLINITQQNIEHNRQESRHYQIQQAERMVKRSRIELQHGQKGDNVAVPIPLVDRGRGDPRNLLAVILDRSDNDNYTKVTKHGILKGAYTRNEFELCPQRLMDVQDMDTTKLISLRQAVIIGSSSGGQGFIKCNCAGSKKCQTNRCKCFKSKLVCNSRCHHSLSCKNK